MFDWTLIRHKKLLENISNNYMDVSAVELSKLNIESLGNWGGISFEPINFKPDNLPEKWKLKEFNAYQAAFNFYNIIEIEIESWRYFDICGFDIFEKDSIIVFSVTGIKTKIIIKCEFVEIAGPNGYVKEVDS